MALQRPHSLARIIAQSLLPYRNKKQRKLMPLLFELNDSNKAMISIT
jgi:hypothetical protein